MPHPTTTPTRQHMLRRWDSARPVLLAGLAGLVAGALACVLRAALDPLAVWAGGWLGYTPPGMPGEGGLLMSFGSVSGGWTSPALLVALPLLGALYAWLTPAHRGDPLNQLVWFGTHKQEHPAGPGHELGALGAGVAAYAGGLMVGRAGAFVPLGAITARVIGWGTRLSTGEQHTLTLAGAAAALGAVLHAPLAAAVLVAEVLYRRFEFEYEVLVSCVLAAVVAYALYGSVYGFSPLFGALAGAAPLAHSFGGLNGWAEWLGAAAITLATAFAAMAALWLGERLPRPAHMPTRLIAGATFGALTALLALAVSPALLGSGEGWLGLSLAGLLGEDTLGIALWRWGLLVVGLPLFFGAGILPSAALGGLLGGGLSAALGVDAFTGTLLGATAFLTVMLNTPVAAALLAMAWGGEGMLPAALLSVALAHFVSGDRSLLPAQALTRSTAAPTPELQTASAQAVAGERRLYTRAVPGSWHGVALGHLQLPPSVEVVAVQRGEEMLMPRWSLRLLRGDRISLLARPDAYHALETWLELPELK